LQRVAQAIDLALARLICEQVWLEGASGGNHGAV
jgi:hypothetical protein